MRDDEETTAMRDDEETTAMPRDADGTATVPRDRDGTAAEWRDGDGTATELQRTNGVPERPSDLTARQWWGALRRTVREFRDDNLTDWAAALTYYSVLSLFPALIALVAILGLVGTEKTASSVLEIVDALGPASAVDTFRGPVEGVIDSSSYAGLALVLSLAVALWTASGYIGAFMRAANQIYEVEEGRLFWTRRPLQIAMTLACVLILAVVLIAIVVTGPLAEAIGDQIGVGGITLTLWNWGKWPLLIAMVLGVLTLLYYLSPNVRPSSLRWITPGTVLALAIWIAASAGFALYVANFGSYEKTYGSLTGVIVFLIWMWITNVAVLLGMELDAELERGRQLAAGNHDATEQIQLEPRREATQA